MKRIVYIRILAAMAAVAALVLSVSCHRDDSSGENAAKNPSFKSFEEQFFINEVMNMKEVYTPTWGADGKLSAMHVDYYSLEYDKETDEPLDVALFQKQQLTYTWNDDFSAEAASAVESYDSDTDTWSPESPATYKLTFDDTWKVTESVFSIGEYGETYRYTYDGDYLTTTEDVGDYHYNLTWKDGDLVQIVCIFDLGPISNTEYSFKYSSDENPFVDGINPLFQIIEDDNILFGLAGKHSAHLPTELSKKDFNGDIVKTYDYVRDSKGRITEVKLIEPYDEVFEMAVYTKYVFHY